jgi:PAS domain S-box-containing protein
MKSKVHPTGVERFFGEDDIIVTKTNLKGIITYANDVFVQISGYTEEELLGQQHNLIRHPDMPRCVFRLLWQTIAAGEEIFAYVKNMAKNGDFYWVFAHVTPTFDQAGRIIGYHSNRRVPERKAVDHMDELYKRLRGTELRESDPEEAIRASTRLLEDALTKTGMPYEELMFAL